MPNRDYAPPPSTKLAGTTPEFLVDEFGFIYLKHVYAADQEIRNLQNHRAIAIVLVNMIDLYLEALLKNNFVEDHDLLSEVFRPEGGSMASARTKAVLCYLMKLIDLETYKCVSDLSRIRNWFAHKLHISSFSATEIKNLLNTRVVTWDKHVTPKYHELPSELEKFVWLCNKAILNLQAAGAGAYIGRFDTGQVEKTVQEHWKAFFEKRGEQYPLDNPS